MSQDIDLAERARFIGDVMFSAASATAGVEDPGEALFAAAASNASKGNHGMAAELLTLAKRYRSA